LKMSLVMLFVVALGQAGELHHAARYCEVERMKQVLAQRLPINELDEKGMTPLHVAIEARKRACVSLLILAGADRDLRDPKGRTAVEAAAQSGDQGIALAVKTLGRPTGGESAGAMPWTLESSVMRGQDGVTKTLLDMGMNPNVVGKGGTTPLADAALKGNVAVVRALLARGAEVKAVSQAGTQPIHDAAISGSVEVIRELVKGGADVNARTRDEGQTALHIAAVMDRMKAVEALVELGADLTLKDKKGRTAVEVAVGEIAAFLKGKVGSSRHR
jgi:uncharacterized protein